MVRVCFCLVAFFLFCMFIVLLLLFVPGRVKEGTCSKNLGRLPTSPLVYVVSSPPSFCRSSTVVSVARMEVSKLTGHKGCLKEEP